VKRIASGSLKSRGVKKRGGKKGPEDMGAREKGGTRTKKGGERHFGLPAPPRPTTGKV